MKLKRGGLEPPLPGATSVLGSRIPFFVAARLNVCALHLGSLKQAGRMHRSWPFGRRFDQSRNLGGPASVQWLRLHAGMLLGKFCSFDCIAISKICQYACVSVGCYSSALETFGWNSA